MGPRSSQGSASGKASQASESSEEEASPVPQSGDEQAALQGAAEQSWVANADGDRPGTRSSVPTAQTGTPVKGQPSPAPGPTTDPYDDGYMATADPYATDDPYSLDTAAAVGAGDAQPAGDNTANQTSVSMARKAAGGASGSTAA